MKSINCNGTLIDLEIPRVMGIINCTPDSFYDGGRTVSKEAILNQAENMLEAGATFLDLGGYSSRPGAADVDVGEELSRVIPAIKSIKDAFPESLISVDTFRSKVVKAAIDAGAVIVNDISAGLLDENMLAVVAERKVPYIAMHMKGSPQTMHEHASYDNITFEVLDYLEERKQCCYGAGIDDVILDPGFGFAKNRKHNFELLNNLRLLNELEAPILVGISRKSMIFKTLEIGPDEALNGTTVLNTVALLKGASLLRVHDVKAAVECVQLLQNLKNQG